MLGRVIVGCCGSVEMRPCQRNLGAGPSTEAGFEAGGAKVPLVGPKGIAGVASSPQPFYCGLLLRRGSVGSSAGQHSAIV
ncbi:hypothetical protein LCGC14_1762610 [marine sediment metagenome]|uniref:Uncharacterized protein n=1 Tax=marine sediment metagenome TaxID=412755 RepID=A0A0F9H0I4_9ZZZZ